MTHYPAVVALSEAFPDQIVNYHMGYFLDEDNLGKLYSEIVYNVFHHVRIYH